MASFRLQNTKRQYDSKLTEMLMKLLGRNEKKKKKQQQKKEWNFNKISGTTCRITPLVL